MQGLHIECLINLPRTSSLHTSIQKATTTACLHYKKERTWCFSKTQRSRQSLLYQVIIATAGIDDWYVCPHARLVWGQVLGFLWSIEVVIIVHFSNPYSPLLPQSNLSYSCFWCWTIWESKSWLLWSAGLSSESHYLVLVAFAPVSSSSKPWGHLLGVYWS